MTKEQYHAVGNFIYTYYTDLNYIRNFQNFKRGNISSSDYLKKDEGTFYTFLVEFRIIRNIKKGSVDKLLRETLKWVKSKRADDVDGFAEHLMRKGLTRGNIMRSLASKVLFLNNPWTIIPMDALARIALNLTENNYSLYNLRLNEYRNQDRANINQFLKLTKPFITLIEKEYRDDINDLPIIRKNRIADKLLWATGRNTR